MARHGRNIRDVNALILSHEHGDHIRCAGVWHRMFQFPIYVTPLTHRAAGKAFGVVRDLRYFLSGDTLEFGDVRVHTLRTPHDAADGVVFIVEHDGRRLGIFSDLGHPFAALRTALAGVDAAYLESNYDPEMLAASSYSPQLKARIRGDAGHLSNDEAAELLHETGRRQRWVVLAHLSEHNNHPDVALRTHRRRLGTDFPLHVARRDAVSELFTL